jgi:hypothetical protein
MTVEFAGERVGSENVPNNPYAQDGQELGASAGVCRAGSLAGARFRPLPAPPARLSAPFACHAVHTAINQGSFCIHAPRQYRVCVCVV